MAYNYSYDKFDKAFMARAHGTNLPVSLKKSVEVASAIRGKKVSTVIDYLEKVTKLAAVVPYKRYHAEMAHRKGSGIDNGGYPIKVAEAYLKLIKAAQKNASEQEIEGELRIVSVSARKGSSRYHYGRYSGRKMKSTNIEVVVGVKVKKEEEKSD